MQIDTVVCGNCLDVMKDMPDGCVNVIVTDPPYGISLGELCQWDHWPDQRIWQETYRIAKEGGYLVFGVSPHVAHERVSDIVRVGWEVLEVGFWVYGSGRPVHKDRLKRCYDLIYFLSKDGNRKLNTEEGRGAYKANSATGRKGTIKPFRTGRLGRQFHKCTSQSPYKCGEKDYFPANVACEIGCKAFGETKYDLIFAIKRLLPIGRTETTHPTQKPIDLIAQQIKLTSRHGDLVFDPFIGSGTTAVAALKLGRHFYGCDINPEYVEMANKGIEKARLEMSQIEMDF